MDHSPRLHPHTAHAQSQAPYRHTSQQPARLRGASAAPQPTRPLRCCGDGDRKCLDARACRKPALLPAAARQQQTACSTLQRRRTHSLCASLNARGYRGHRCAMAVCGQAIACSATTTPPHHAPRARPYTCMRAHNATRNHYPRMRAHACMRATLPGCVVGACRTRIPSGSGLAAHKLHRTCATAQSRCTAAALGIACMQTCSARHAPSQPQACLLRASLPPGRPLHSRNHTPLSIMH